MNVTDPISSAIIAAELVSVLVLIIISTSIIIDKNKSKANRYFLGCVINTIIILISDILSYSFDGSATYNILQYITNYNTFIFGDVLMIFFVLYVYSFVNERTKTSKLIIYICFPICILDAIFETYGALSKTTFTVIDGNFIPGELYSICFITQLLILFLCLVYLIIKAKDVGFKTLAIFFLYYILPVFSIILILINNDLSFICTSIAISFLIIYVGIEKRSKEQLMSDLIRRDVLTGLPNRNAYEEILDSFINDSDNFKIGIIFSDLNGLKKANDNFGHAAGDELICKYSKLLTNIFGDNNFRISGDEFVTIFKNIDESEFEDKVKELEEIVLSNDNISSFGFAYGDSNKVKDLIISSEKKMYDYKARYYTTFGIERRR